MMIFIRPLIIFFVFFPADLMGFTCPLLRADFNTGETVYENKVKISSRGDRQYTISSPNGMKTFRTFDFRTMIGKNVELETLGRDPKIWCLFPDLSAAQGLYRDVRPNRGPSLEMAFPVLSTEIIATNDNGVEQVSNIIARGKIVVELRNRFQIVPDGYRIPDMIFTCKNFNMSQPVAGGRILLVVRLYEINLRETISMRFILNFNGDLVAQTFYSHVKQIPDCINNSITVVFPDNFLP